MNTKIGTKTMASGKVVSLERTVYVDCDCNTNCCSCGTQVKLDLCIDGRSGFGQIYFGEGLDGGEAYQGSTILGPVIGMTEQDCWNKIEYKLELL